MVYVEVYTTTAVSSTQLNNVISALDDFGSQVNFSVTTNTGGTSYDPNDVDCSDFAGTLYTFEDWLNNNNHLSDDDHFMLLTDKSACGPGGAAAYSLGQDVGQQYSPKSYGISWTGVNDSTASYQNTAIQEFCHTIMGDVDGDCPETGTYADHHSCGRTYEDPYTNYHTVSPMLSGYVGLATDDNWDVCPEVVGYDDYTKQTTDCTQTHTEDYVSYWGV